MEKPLYIYGSETTADERKVIWQRFFPGKMVPKGLTAATVLHHIHARFPLRLEHEVNRLRRWAFDAGDEGFTYERIEPCPHSEPAPTAATPSKTTASPDNSVSVPSTSTGETPCEKTAIT